MRTTFSCLQHTSIYLSDQVARFIPGYRSNALEDLKQNSTSARLKLDKCLRQGESSDRFTRKTRLQRPRLCGSASLYLKAVYVFYVGKMSFLAYAELTFGSSAEATSFRHSEHPDFHDALQKEAAESLCFILFDSNLPAYNT